MCFAHSYISIFNIIWVRLYYRMISSCCSMGFPVLTCNSIMLKYAQIYIHVPHHPIITAIVHAWFGRLKGHCTTVHELTVN